MPSDAVLRHGARAAAGLLGVDALYRAESADGDGLVVLNMARDGEVRAEPFADYVEASAFFEALRREAGSLPEPDRRAYYERLGASTLAFVAWRAGGLPFEDRLSRFLHVPPRPAPDAEVEALLEALHETLGRTGAEGDLRARCADWEARNAVPPEAVPEVLTGLLAEGWRRTGDALVEIPAEPDDGMRVQAVSGVAYNARCDYAARTLELNTDPVLTRPGLKHLAAHEGCPGHYLQFKLRETLFRRGEAPADVLLSVVNTASSPVFEGIADAGLDAVGWIEDDDDRVQHLLNRHRAALATGAAWRLHAEGCTPEAVAGWLRDGSLTGGEGWVANRVAFVAAPSRAVLAWSYWAGEPAVARAWRAVPEGRRPDFVRFLYGRMHATDTVGMFDA